MRTQEVSERERNTDVLESGAQSEVQLRIEKSEWATGTHSLERAEWGISVDRKKRARERYSISGERNGRNK